MKGTWLMLLQNILHISTTECFTLSRTQLRRKKARIGARERNKKFHRWRSRLFPVPFFGADTPISKVDLTFVALHDDDDDIDDVGIDDDDNDDDNDGEGDTEKSLLLFLSFLPPPRIRREKVQIFD